MAVLTVTARLFLVLTFCFRSTADGFTISNLRFGEFHVNAVTCFYFLCKHFKLYVALTADNHFARFSVLFNREGVIFFFQLCKPCENLIFFSLLFSRNGHKQGGFREENRGETNLCRRIAKGVACIGVTELIYGTDIACRQLVNGFHLLTAKHVNLPDTFFRFGVRIPNGRTALQNATEALDIAKFTRERIDNGFENLRREGCVFVRTDTNHLVGADFVSKGIQTFACLGHVRNDFVQKVDNTTVLKRRTCHDGNGVNACNTDTDTTDGFFTGQFARFEEFIEQEFVVFSRCFHKGSLHFRNLILHVVGDGDFLRTAFLEEVSTFLQSVDTALHFAAFHDRDLDGCNFTSIFCTERLYGAEVICIFFIHTVDEDDEWFTKLQAIFDDGFCADGQYAVCADNQARAACRTKTFVAFAFEIVVAGQIKDIHLNVFPH